MNKIAVATLLLPLSLVAAEIAGVTFPETKVIGGKTLLLNGAALRTKTIFNVSVYAAALYLPRHAADAAEIYRMPGTKRVELTFLRSVSTAEVRTSWDEGFQWNCDERCVPITGVINELKDLSRDIAKGQSVIFDVEGDKVTLRMADATPKTLEGPALGEMVLANFIGKVPPSEAVRDGMLGKDRPARDVAGGIN